MFSPGPPPFLQHCSMCVCLLLALKNRINIVEVFLTPSFHQLPSAETKRDLALFGLRRVFSPPHYINIQGGGGVISPVGLHCFRVMSTVSFGFTVLANDFAGFCPLCICTVLKCVIVQTLVWFTKFMDNERGPACILCLDFK